MMLEQVLRYIRNWFPASFHNGTFVIENGTIDLPFMQNGQYFRIVGSVFNDGVYQYPAELQDETFNGSVWALAIPKAVLDIVSDIEEWNVKNADRVNSPYQSESFGGYSYTLKAGNGSGGGATWQSTFASRLNAWRKI